MLTKFILWLLKKCNKRELLKEAVKDLYCAVSSEDILKSNPDGSLRFMDMTLAPDRKKSLKEQAEMLEKMMLWRILKKDIEYQINKKMFKEAKCDLDVVWGQLLTFLWDVIEDRLSKIKKY